MKLYHIPEPTQQKRAQEFFYVSKIKGSCQIHSTTLLQVIDKNHKMKVTHKVINITDCPNYNYDIPTQKKKKQGIF